MKASDVGISVDTAVDIAKESADVILLEKNLMVLENGIIEGRKTYANMIKYIKMTASSNFGNMFSVLAASAFLPFLPMLPIHLILLNLIYDVSCTAIPWDNVDEEFLAKPRKWDASSIGKFMLWIGPTSSVFDITTYLLMYFIICPAVCGGLFTQLTDPAMKVLYIGLFQAGWFVESMWSQTLVIHMIRTPKIPFLQSRASAPLTLLTFTGIAVLTIIPFTAFGAKIGFSPLPSVYFAWLVLTIALYMMLAQSFKLIFIRLYGDLL
jgi:Mg2+-importing ATPase